MDDFPQPDLDPNAKNLGAKQVRLLRKLADRRHVLIDYGPVRRGGFARFRWTGSGESVDTGLVYGLARRRLIERVPYRGQWRVVLADAGRAWVEARS